MASSGMNFRSMMYPWLANWSKRALALCAAPGPFPAASSGVQSKWFDASRSPTVILSRGILPLTTLFVPSSRNDCPAPLGTLALPPTTSSSSSSYSSSSSSSSSISASPAASSSAAPPAGWYGWGSLGSRTRFLLLPALIASSRLGRGRDPRSAGRSSGRATMVLSTVVHRLTLSLTDTLGTSPPPCAMVQISAGVDTVVPSTSSTMSLTLSPASVSAGDSSSTRRDPVSTPKLVITSGARADTTSTSVGRASVDRSHSRMTGLATSV
mmetsp:Transcript_17861/g.52147  ORF Transcript_17861/g.52147 Transcript_17861/m.52147 type:complete len:268 (-) Transcript_17861:33-836(-)